MGEQDEKETSPSSDPPPQQQQQQQETDEPKETDKMLESAKQLNSVSGGGGTNEDQLTKNPIKNSDDKINNILKNGEEIINMADNDTTTTTSTITSAISGMAQKKSASGMVTEEGREVKPKKIPIGGIKMPGFFTKSKPRSEGDGADGELLENEGNDNKANEEKPKDNIEKPTPNIGERIRNFFIRKQQQPERIDEENKDSKNESTTEIDGVPPRKGLLNAIKLPIANKLPKKKTENGEDVELGKGPGTKAGLASMETLDDSLKDQEKKDEEQPRSILCLNRILSYRCSPDDIFITMGIVVIISIVATICVIALYKNEPKIAPVRDGRFVQAVTSCGMIEGMFYDGAFAFRGVPYALPPIGENRFSPAKPIESIDHCWNGTFIAHNQTDLCLQILSNGTTIGVEDCLTLDVLSPRIRYDNPLPVVVLIGAESLTGGSPGILRPSSRYARSRDVIFVRPNFRMGPFGFLALNALSKSTYPPTSGNYGLSDIIAALKWIKLNIVHFGGDPNSVTLFGHRAGGTLVSALITSRQIKDLYTRAWVTSSGAIFPGRTISESEKRNHEYLEQIQCSDVECLRDASESTILDAIPDTWRYYPPELPTSEENATAQHEWLVLDGYILQEHPVNVWSEDIGKPPKLVIGATAHESHSEKLHLKHNEWTPELVRKYIEGSKIGHLNLTDEVIKRYNATYQGLISMLSDIRTICPLLANARLQPAVPFYVVTQIDNKLHIADVDADVSAILGRYEPHTPEQRRYVASIQALFYHYVSHGEMKQYDPRRRVIEVGQDALSWEDYPNCAFWIKSDIVPRYARID